MGQQSTQYAQTLTNVASNPKLINIVNNTYKVTDTISGGTFGAVRNELITGQPTAGTFHFEKMMNTLSGLSNVLKSGNLTQGDLGVISTLINNASKAISAASKIIR